MLIEEGPTEVFNPFAIVRDISLLSLSNGGAGRSALPHWVRECLRL